MVAEEFPATKEGKLQCAMALQVFVCIAFSNIPLAKASHMAEQAQGVREEYCSHIYNLLHSAPSSVSRGDGLGDGRWRIWLMSSSFQGPGWLRLYLIAAMITK